MSVFILITGYIKAQKSGLADTRSPHLEADKYPMRDSSLSSLQRVRQPKNLKHQSMINATLKATDAPNALLAARPPVA
ncbi:hypothetical protein, partial [Vibrio parahaemolyticus]|uniref:hypothetical protein n=1 Tax=Vibrio parahaemolyticus TaxID=670 RepID=UPI001E55E2C4